MQLALQREASHPKPDTLREMALLRSGRCGSNALPCLGWPGVREATTGYKLNGALLISAPFLIRFCTGERFDADRVGLAIKLLQRGANAKTALRR